VINFGTKVKLVAMSMAKNLNEPDNYLRIRSTKQTF